VSEPGAGEHGAMNIATATGFGTSSSSLIALPRMTGPKPPKPVWHFGRGHPDAVQFSDVSV
jgi:hypothetical protein